MGSSTKPYTDNYDNTGRLRKGGYEPMLDYYLKGSQQLNEPLYTRPAWTALSEAEGYSGVRGAPHRLQAVRPSTPLAVRFFFLLFFTLSK